MDKLTLFQIDEELESSEVAALCFLCRDVVSRRHLATVEDAKGLFLRLKEQGLLENSVFLSQLFNTIRRADLLSLLEIDCRETEETDGNLLSDYRVMLYQIYEDMTRESVEKMKFLLSGKLDRSQIEPCNTALDVFLEMEKVALLSDSNLDELHAVLREIDRHLALTVQCYIEEVTQQHQSGSPSHLGMVSNTPQVVQAMLSISETQPSSGGVQTYSDAEPTPHCDQMDYYALNRIPRGLCVVINNEFFSGTDLKNRRGTQEDEKALIRVFTQLGFTVVVHNNLTAEDIRRELRLLSTRNFLNDDALVVCVLTHGEKGHVRGTDGLAVSIRELTKPFTSNEAPSLAGKPKLFFIQACQGTNFQAGLPLFPVSEERVGGPKMRSEEAPSPGDKPQLQELTTVQRETDLPTVEEGPFSVTGRWMEPGSRQQFGTVSAAQAGGVFCETVPSDADFLVGMATVPDCRTFRNISTGSIYIQELCRQLTRSAQSLAEEDILTVLLRVNKAVGRGVFLNHKQMPEPKFTLTRKLVLKFINPDQQPAAQN